MENTITGILIDTTNSTTKVVTIPKTLKAYYETIGCDCIDIVHRRIGNQRRYYDIICDDEALLKDAPLISAIDNYGSAMLVNSLLIVKFDGTDDITSLDDDDIKYIKRYIMPQGTRKHPTPYPMLHQCEY